MSDSDEVEYNFNLASNYIQSHHNQFNNENLLKFYGFYKQATIGAIDVNSSRPSFFKMQERSKYDAWKAVGSMTKQEAMESYVNILNHLIPDWICDVKENSKGSSGSFGFSVSRPQSEDSIIESDKEIQDYVKEGNIEKLKDLLSFIKSSDLNQIDNDGLGLIHWAADRGNYDALELLLNTEGIDINLQDADGQSALFYASSVGHHKCLELLLKNGADKNLVDSENNTCCNVAYDDEIRKILS